MTAPPHRPAPGPLPGLDLGRLAEHLDRARPGLVAGPLTAELVSGGRSNLTYRVADGVHAWVLRRPPLGHVLATAHDMAREYRVMSALAGTPVPVPAMELLCEDPAVLGAPFYVMEYLRDPVLRDAAQVHALTGEQAVGLAEGLVDTLADLHGVDPDAIGLGALGRPQGYLERQVRTWGRQLAASHSRDVPELAELGRRLALDPPPTTRPAIVHGDYRLDNVLVDLAGPVPRITAVLDWEMATLGEALADVAMMLAWYDGVSGLDSPVAVVPGDVPTFPPGAALLDRYADRTGSDLTTMPWQLGLAYFKIGAIFEGIHFRHLAGQTVGEGFDRLGALVRPIAERGLTALGAP